MQPIEPPESAEMLWDEIHREQHDAEHREHTKRKKASDPWQGTIGVMPCYGKLIILASTEASLTGTQRMHDGCLLFNPNTEIAQSTYFISPSAARVAAILRPRCDWESCRVASSPTGIITSFMDLVTRVDATQIGLVAAPESVRQLICHHFAPTYTPPPIPREHGPSLFLFSFDGADHLLSVSQYIHNPN